MPETWNTSSERVKVNTQSQNYIKTAISQFDLVAFNVNQKTAENRTGESEFKAAVT